MKKFLFLVLSLILILSFTACEMNNDFTSSDDDSSSDEVSETASSDNEEISDTTETNNSQSSETASEDVEWEEFLAEYEAWVDDYIEFMEKYEKNPTDMTLLADYSQMMTDMAEWSEKADEVAADLETASPSELAEYNAELARILNKLTEAMQ